MDGKVKLEPNNNAKRLKASFIESMLSGKVHRPKEQGRRSHAQEMAAQFL
jgi:hypothetical protein